MRYPLLLFIQRISVGMITIGIRSYDAHFTQYFFIFSFSQSVDTWLYLVAPKAFEILNKINILFWIFLLVLHTLL